MAQTRELVAYLNGRFVPYSEAVAVMDEGQSRSSGGLYDAERTFNGQVFKLRQHLQRLYRGLEFARIDPGMSLEEMEAATLEVLEANRPQMETGDDLILGQVVSVVATSGSNAKPDVDVAIYCNFIDFAAFAQRYITGVRVVTPVTYAVPGLQSSDGAEGAVLETMPLLTDAEGNITECRHANFMFVRQGRIKLPDRRKVLPGISMETALDLAGSLEIPVDEDDYCTADVYIADEAFVSGTRYCLLPVATLNGVNLGQEVPGPVTRRMLAAWSERVGVDFVQQALDHLPGGSTKARSDEGSG